MRPSFLGLQPISTRQVSVTLSQVHFVQCERGFTVYSSDVVIPLFICERSTSNMKKTVSRSSELLFMKLCDVYI